MVHHRSCLIDASGQIEDTRSRVREKICVPSSDVLEWLLDPSNPSARYLTLRDLFDESAESPSVREVQASIPIWEPVRQILAMVNPVDFWGRARRPFYGGALSTQATLSLLAELGLPSSPIVEAACEHLLADGQCADGGFGPDTQGAGMLCYTGIAIRTLLQFGFTDDPRVERAIDSLVARVTRPGGLTCPCCPERFCGWGVAKALTAFAALPPALRSPERIQAARELADMILDYKFDFDGVDARWLEFGFPLDYQSDLVELCDALAGLGFLDPLSDVRFATLLDVLANAQTHDGRWIKHFGTRVFSVEKRGVPSKWITLRALRAFKRVGRIAANAVRAVLRERSGGESV